MTEKRRQVRCKNCERIANSQITCSSMGQIIICFSCGTPHCIGKEAFSIESCGSLAYTLDDKKVVDRIPKNRQ